MIVILRQYPLVKFIFACAKLTEACAKQTGSCGCGYEIIRRNFNRNFCSLIDFLFVLVSNFYAKATTNHLAIKQN